MRVWYGFSKLTKKAVRKQELAIYYENSPHIAGNKDEWVRKRMTVVHVRTQSSEERKDGIGCSRMFTKYRYFIEDKPFFGDIDKVLYSNSEADKNHVSLEERTVIQEKLRKQYYECYDVKKRIVNQLSLDLFKI